VDDFPPVDQDRRAWTLVEVQWWRRRPEERPSGSCGQSPRTSTGIVVEVIDLARDGSSSPDGDYAR